MGRQKLSPHQAIRATTPEYCAGALRAVTTTMITTVEVDDLTDRIIACAIEVHRHLGPGLLESVYRECMKIELRENQLHVDSERHVPINYKGKHLNAAFQVDLLVEGCVIVELKAVDLIHPIHLAQVITYLKLTTCPAGLLMNFNSTSLRSGLRRLNHPDRFVRKTSF